MRKRCGFFGFYRYLMAGSLVWISSTGFAASPDKADHAEAATEGSTPTVPQTSAAKPKAKGAEDAKTRRQAALKRMKEALDKTSNTTLRQFTGQLAQFQKVDPGILGGIVDKLPGLNEELTKSLKDTFSETFPELGETADADLARVVAELLAARFGGDADKAKGKDDGETDNEKVRAAIDKALADKLAEGEKAKQGEKSALEKFKEDLNKQFEDLLKASKLAQNDKDKANLGDIPEDLGAKDAGAGETPSDSGSGGGDSPSGGSGGGDKAGNNTPTEKPTKDTSAKNELQPLKLGETKSSSESKATPKAEEEFSLDSPKKEATEKPATLPTGAKAETAAAQPPASDVIDPTLGSPRSQPSLSGNSSAASGISPFPSAGADTGNGGGGAGIQINGASPTPLSSGDGDVGAGLGNQAQVPAEDRGRFVYQRTRDSDWIAPELANVDAGDGSGSGSAPETLSYASSKAGVPNLAAIGISSRGEESRGPTESFGVLSSSPLKLACDSPAGPSVGVCGVRAAMRASKAGPARRLGSLFEKAQASGFIKNRRNRAN